MKAPAQRVKTGALAIARFVDRLNELLGVVASWLVLLMILVGAFNALVRYLDRYTGWGLASNFYLELQWYLFSLVFLLGAAYVLKRDAHVRVDVLYGRYSRRTQAWVNLLGTLFFLLPFSSVALVVSWPAVRNSWKILEVSSDPGGLPRYPIKTMVLVAFGLLILQGLREVVRQLEILAGREATAGDAES